MRTANSDQRHANQCSMTMVTRAKVPSVCFVDWIANEFSHFWMTDDARSTRATAPPQHTTYEREREREREAGEVSSEHARDCYYSVYYYSRLSSRSTLSTLMIFT